MERWCTTHHIRELMDEFVVEFLRAEAASAPVESDPAVKGVAAVATPAASFAAPPVPQVYGELYTRYGGQAYAYHAGELVGTSSRQPPTIAALRAFLKRKWDSKAAWQSAHPYIVLLVEGGAAARELREASASSSSLSLPLHPAEPPSALAPLSSTVRLTQEAAFSSIVAVAAQSVARSVGGIVQSLTPALLPEPDTALLPRHRPLEQQQQQQQQLLQELARDIASRTGVPMVGTPSFAGGGTTAVVAAQSTSMAAHGSAAAQRTPVVFADERWPYTIADGLALEGLLGSPIAVFSVSIDERDRAEAGNAVENSNAVASDGTSSALLQRVPWRGSSAHAALLEYYAAKKKLTELTVPAGVCRAVAQAASPPHDVALNAAARAAAESLAEQIACHLH
ncbi:hypothetical protein Q4I30_003953 [Leishmania utingensis]|uniref:Uncharacterized protein n=1 Tax=Leishmania utingensis TaxID=653362 RepID=A0AAW3AJH9_9TRYP